MKDKCINSLETVNSEIRVQQSKKGTQGFWTGQYIVRDIQFYVKSYCFFSVWWLLVPSTCLANGQSRLQVIRFAWDLSAWAPETAYGWPQQTESQTRSQPGHCGAVGFIVLLSQDHCHSLQERSCELSGSTCCRKHQWCKCCPLDFADAFFVAVSLLLLMSRVNGGN